MPDGPLSFERPLGAFPRPGGVAEFRVWAPRAAAVRLRVDGREHDLAEAGHGVREATVEAQPGADYEYLVDGEALPDPASRWQPAGLRGPSRVLDPAAFAWTDERFRPPPLRDAVLYELHVGT